jgi:chromosome segregation ATPase
MDAINKASSEVEILTKEREDLGKEVSKLQQEILELNNANSSYVSRSAQLKTDLESLKTQHASDLNKLAHELSEVTSLKDEQEKLLQQVQSNIESLREQIAYLAVQKVELLEDFGERSKFYSQEYVLSCLIC